jgi:hypothetical protein
MRCRLRIEMAKWPYKDHHHIHESVPPPTHQYLDSQLDVFAEADVTRSFSEKIRATSCCWP